jgi:alkanesulfonate monooxygenase SsuD/methylene tetrahydromethanopterin reductase-like flavin-dependent oxidoreductase (luciferase family)
LAGPHATIFNTFAAPWEWDAVNADIDHAARQAGRDPGAICRSAYVFADFSGDPARSARLLTAFLRTRGGTEEQARRRIMMGDPEHLIAVVKGYESAGVGLMILNLTPPWDLEGLDRFAHDVMPACGS